MDPSSGQLQQEMSSNTLENMLVCSKAQQDQKKPRPQPEQALKCPRCDSTNTKFCYYNNYSLSQPRYFCKSCRRYWTKGGTLRNVPVGGGCRKNKRSSSSSSSKRSQDQNPLITSNQNPLTHHHHHLTYDSNDLTLAFARLQKQSGLGFDHHPDHDQFSILGNPNTDILGNQTPAFLDALRCGYLDHHQGQNHNQNSFQNMYYGGGGYGNNAHIGDHNQVDHNGSSECGAMVMPYGSGGEMSSTNATTTAVTVTTLKQEFCNGGGVDNQNNRQILWGFPWQINGDRHHHQSNSNVNMSGDLDSGRESWNGLAPSWHGLLNSPLM